MTAVFESGCSLFEVQPEEYGDYIDQGEDNHYYIEIVDVEEQ